MKITEKDVQYVADLANLELTDAERLRMEKDLNSILEYVEMLNRLDTTGVEPMAQVATRYGSAGHSGAGRFSYAMRDDEPRPSLPREEGMKNAPDTDGVLFKVPKVIER